MCVCMYVCGTCVSVCLCVHKCTTTTLYTLPLKSEFALSPQGTTGSEPLLVCRGSQLAVFLRSSALLALIWVWDHEETYRRWFW